MAVKVLDSAQLNNKHPSVFVLSYELYGSGFRGYESATGQVYIMSDNPEGAIYRLEAPIKIAGKTVVSQGILKQILPLSEADKKIVYENNYCGSTVFRDANEAICAAVLYFYAGGQAQPIDFQINDVPDKTKGFVFTSVIDDRKRSKSHRSVYKIINGELRRTTYVNVRTTTTVDVINSGIGTLLSQDRFGRNKLTLITGDAKRVILNERLNRSPLSTVINYNGANWICPVPFGSYPAEVKNVTKPVVILPPPYNQAPQASDANFINSVTTNAQLPKIPQMTSEQLHECLDLLGLLPVVGEPADVLNSILYITEGDLINAVVSSGAAVPLFGYAAGLGKSVFKRMLNGDAVVKCLTNGLTDVIKKAEKSISNAVLSVNDVFNYAEARAGISNMAKTDLDDVLNKRKTRWDSVAGDFKGVVKIGDFTKVKNLDDFKARIPSNAQQLPWKSIEGGAAEGVKYKWTDANGDVWNVRAHSIDPSAPAGSNASKGWIYRVEVRYGGAGKTYYMDSSGNFHPENVMNPNSPMYNEAIANDTHIPFSNR